jgi:starch synthase
MCSRLIKHNFSRSAFDFGQGGWVYFRTPVILSEVSCAGTLFCGHVLFVTKSRKIGGRPMRVLFMSSEVYPLIKTGGLADVSAALAATLAELGVDIDLLLPGYPKALEAATKKSVQIEVADFMGAGPMRLISARTPDTNLRVWLVDCPSLYQRSGGPYQDENGHDWPDNFLRFAIFNHVAAKLSCGLLLPDYRADIVHANDWHTGLLPVILAGTPGQKPATVFTIHNLAFQGVFPAEIYPRLGLPDSSLAPEGLEFYGKLSFLKAGLSYSDRLTTVSPTYAQEILTAESGCGLEGVLQHRAKDLAGILNGADYHVWDPATDAHLASNYNVQDIAGKRVCKTALQEELGLDVEPETPLVVFVSRLTDQKMADVVADAVPGIVDRGAQFALVGDGDRAIEERFQEVARQYPGRIAVRIGYEEPLAHRIMAGGDILLHPSRFEPCGLTQLYGMHYGTVPVVRNTGGLRDTVVDTNEHTIRQNTATGFVFEGANTPEMLHCIERALALYRQPLVWRKVKRQAMAMDFSWTKSAHQYLALYHELAPHSTMMPEAITDAAVREKQPAKG